MAASIDARVVQCLQGRPEVSSHPSSSSRTPLDALVDEASLLDVLLYMNTCETILFWSLRSLVRTVNSLPPATQSGEGAEGAAPDESLRLEVLSQACDAVQAAQDTLNAALVPYLVRPALVRALHLYVADCVVDGGTLDRDVAALFSADSYCEEQVGVEEEVAEQQGPEIVWGSDTDHTTTTTTASSSATSSALHDGSDAEALLITSDSEEEQDTGHVQADDHRKRWSRLASRDPRHREEVAQRSAERQRQRRWQRGRDRVLHAAPPLSSAATFLLSLVKALHQKYLRAQQVHSQNLLPVPGTTPATVTRSTHGTRFAASGAAPPVLEPLPCLFPRTVSSMTSRRSPPSRYAVLARHPYTIASLFPPAAFAAPPHPARHHQFLDFASRGRHTTHSRIESEGRDGLVLTFRPAQDEEAVPLQAVTSSPDKVHCRRRRGLLGPVRDPYAVAAAWLTGRARRAKAEPHHHRTETAASQTVTESPCLSSVLSASLKRGRDEQEADAAHSPTKLSEPTTQLSGPVRFWSIGLPGLPREVQHHVLLFLPPRCILTAARVCRLWRGWITAPSSHAFSSPLPYYAAASRAVTRCYFRFFREDWGERCLQLPTLTSVQRLHALRLAKVAAAVQALWDSVEGDAVVRQWAWTRARALRVCHVAACLEATSHESVMADFVEPPELRRPVSEASDTVATRAAWGCAPQAVSRSAGVPGRLPVDYVVLYLWHEYPADAPARQALVFLLDALSQELVFSIVFPASATTADAATAEVSRGASLAVEEVLRQQYLLWVLLQGDPSSAGGAAHRTSPVLYELWRHWPRIGALWSEIQRVGSFH